MLITHNIVINQQNAYLCNNAWLTSLTLLYHSTYTSTYDYIHMHFHSIQASKNPNKHKRNKTKQKKLKTKRRRLKDIKNGLNKG